MTPKLKSPICFSLICLSPDKSATEIKFDPKTKLLSEKLKNNGF